MPNPFWRPTCNCRPTVIMMGSPCCQVCGKPGVWLGWGYGMIEMMAVFERRTGMRSMGPHRGMTRQLLESRMVSCPTCSGRCLVDIKDGMDCKECPECRGLGVFFKGTKKEFLEIRARILEQFPDAAASNFDPDLLRYLGDED